MSDGKGYQELQKLGNEYGRDSHTGRVMYNNLNEHMKVDLEPQNNKVSGVMKTTNNEIKKGFFFGEEANTHMDYRYFFMNNKNYYDELSTMSLMLCNTLEHNENSGSGDLANLTTLFRRIGLKKWHDESEVEIKTAKYGNSGEVKYVVGENEIEYTHNYTETSISKKVKLIVVKSIDVGKDNIEKIGNDRNNINQHELFEGLARAIYDKEFKGQEFCYWVTGYNTGGAVANVLAAKMIDKGLYYVPKGGIASNSNAYITYDNGQKSTQSKHGQVISNVYCYTFGAPYTVYNGGGITEEENTISSKYASIFNVVSNGDIYGFILPNEFKWGRYGVTCYKVHEDHKKISNESEIDKQQTLKEMRINLVNLIKDVFDVYENDNMFKDNYYSRDYGDTQETNIQKLLNYSLRNQNIPISVTNGIRNNSMLRSRYIVLINFLNRQRKFINDGRDEKINYELSKKILPEDISFMVNTENNRTREIVKVKDMNEELLIQLKNVGEWYCNNIATYQFYSGSHGVTYNENKYISASTPAQARFDEYARFNGYTGNDRFRNNIDERVEGKQEGARALYYAKDLDVDGRPHYDGIIEDAGFELNDGSAYDVSEQGDYNNGAYTDGLYRFGDDCSDFATAVILMTSKGNRGQIATISSASRDGQRGLKLHETNTEMFRNYNNSVTNLNNTGKAMEQLGYHLIDIERDTVLIPGDILMTTNAEWKHTEFYYGYRYRVEVDESGRETVTDELERVQPTNTTYFSTFGWGSTHASFPSADNYFIRVGNRWYLGADRERYYSRLYRKETEELNLKAVREMIDNE